MTSTAVDACLVIEDKERTAKTDTKDKILSYEFLPFAVTADVGPQFLTIAGIKTSEVRASCVFFISLFA